MLHVALASHIVVRIVIITFWFSLPLSLLPQRCLAG